MFETKSTTVPITKQMVKEAYRKVKSNQDSAGVDKESLEGFEVKLLDNLYVLWNRLSSGSYFPKPVREVEIPKSDGSKRKLGIPTVSDRIAQEVIKSYLEPRLEAVFSESSYGYRPLKSAHDAVEEVKQNTRLYAWVLDMDIKAFFDEVSHELLMKAIDCHVEEKWVKLYIKRWLETPSQSANGTLTPKNGNGTPQGGVISPLLANLFLHYVLDKWLSINYPSVAFVRYADDVIVHCQSEEQAKEILEAIRQRLTDCKLRLSEQKTKIVYCLNYARKQRKDYSKKFDFLGFTFKPTAFKSKNGGLFTGFGCTISQKAQSQIIDEWEKLKVHKYSENKLQDIANKLNPQLRGIINYYGKINLGGLRSLFRNLQFRICKWVKNKYKLESYSEGYKWLNRTQKSYPNMFQHWLYFKGL
ncbi:MAG: group II intron reverse transcriptase/maturase [Candidatus Methylacidiphilales bacterium]